jgi:hypothetical protein
METTEQLNTLTSVDVLDKQDAYEALKFEAIEGTPFTVVNENNEYFSIIGNHRITETFLNKEICIEETKKITWDRITQVIWAIATKIDNINKLNNKENE